jgi:hypothetical protein
MSLIERVSNYLAGNVTRGVIVVRIEVEGAIPYLSCPLCGRRERVRIDGAALVDIPCRRCNQRAGKHSTRFFVETEANDGS